MLAKAVIASRKGWSEANFTTPGSYTWNVPFGVTSICVVCVGRGAAGDTYSGGGGGGLGWTNNIAVTPGEECTVVVGNGSTDTSFTAVSDVVIGYRGNGTTGGSYYGAGGGNGGTGLNGSSGWRTGNGGGSGRYSANGANGTEGDTNLVGGLSGGAPGNGVNLNGTDASMGTGYGFGGASAGEFGGDTTPGGGAVRIIWGSGRSFPSNAA